MTQSGRRFLTLVLGLVLGFLALVLVSGTAVALLGGGPAYRSVDSHPAVQKSFTGKSIYGEIGLLRARTSDPDQGLVIVRPSFPYPEGDSAFYEELALKTPVLRIALLDWFSSKSVRELEKLGEEAVKAAVLETVNSLLVLDKLETVYFSDYQILD